MNILITGGTGLVGSVLIKNILDKGHNVRLLTRQKKNRQGVGEYEWDIPNKNIDPKVFEDLDAVIHLAGEGVANKKWSSSQKKKIISSRVDSAQLLFDSISKLEKKPTVIISASGVGFYGIDTGDRLMTEESPKGDGFLADVVDQWESGIDQFDKLGMRIVKLRIGVVLSADGGALSKMVTPVKLGLGSPLGKGTQQMSWVHIEDLSNLLLEAVENVNLKGVYNAVSSNPVTNEELTKSIGKALGRPVFMPNVPSFVLKLLLGEMSVIVTGGNNVSNEKIKKTGFEFMHENLDKTLSQILNKD
ncbi:MAG: hypothetical protein ACJA2S_000867 [Cyclobacteriaceae bacterium]|jgi:uncharacterized protein (TIGR01777 family)